MSWRFHIESPLHRFLCQFCSVTGLQCTMVSCQVKPNSGLPFSGLFHNDSLSPTSISLHFLLLDSVVHYHKRRGYSLMICRKGLKVSVFAEFTAWSTTLGTKLLIANNCYQLRWIIIVASMLPEYRSYSAHDIVRRPRGKVICHA